MLREVSILPSSNSHSTTITCLPPPCAHCSYLASTAGLRVANHIYCSRESFPTPSPPEAGGVQLPPLRVTLHAQPVLPPPHVHPDIATRRNTAPIESRARTATLANKKRSREVAEPKGDGSSSPRLAAPARWERAESVTSIKACVWVSHVLILLLEPFVI